jgi:hypothetical protein
VEVGGLRVTPGGLVRGWLEADLDADGDLDATLLQERPPEEGQTDRVIELLSYRREGDELVAAGGEPLAPALLGGCSITALGLRLAAPGTVTLVLTASCPAATDADGGAPSAVPRVATTALVAGGPLPLRPLVTARLDGDAATMTMDATDRDGDGAADSVLVLVRAGARAEVVWLDRSAGPSIDPTATERSLQAGLPAPAGRKLLQTRLPLVRGIVDLRRLLCTGELEGSTLTMGTPSQSRPARECRTSRATGSAIALLVRGHVDAGRLPQARAALSLLEMEGVGLGEERRAALERSIAAHTTLSIEPTHEPGPPAVVAPPSVGGRAKVRFLDDDRIWVETSPPFIYYVSSRASQPAEPLPTPAALPGGGRDPVPQGGEDMPEARSGTWRAVGAPEGLWIAEGDAWALCPAARIGGGWVDAVSLAMSPSGDAVAAVRRGRLEVVRLRRAVAPVPIVGGDGGASTGRQAGDGGAREAPTGGPGPSGP